MRLHWTVVLVRARRGKEQREDTGILRRAMIESGIPHVCGCCGCLPTWMGRELVLEIDHLSGDWADNERTNLRFLCPNCHTQTRNYGSKARGKLYERDLDEIQMWAGEGNLEDLELSV
jgi:hypothetical protein